MKKNILLAIILTIGFITIQTGCKKEDDTKPPKKLDFITDDSGFFRIDFVYSGNEVQEMVYVVSGDSVIFTFEDGLLIQEMYSNGGHIDYIRDGNDVKAVRSWDTDNILKVYHLNNDNKIRGLTDYKNGEIDKVYEYNYLNGNISEQNRTFPNELLIGTYTYDKNPNPYKDIIVYGDLLTYSEKNVVTTNDNVVADYKYDEAGYVIEANYAGTTIYHFSYK